MDEPIFQCQFCPSAFKARRKFYRHLQDDHSNLTAASLPGAASVRPTNPQKTQVKVMESKTCKICAIEVKTAKLLKVHMKEHLEEQDQNFSCKDCNDKFVSKPDLIHHMKQSHSYTAPKCNKCQVKFETKQMLSDHIRNHHTPTICPKCKQKYPTRVEAKHHYKESHGKSSQNIGTSVKDEKSKMKKEKMKKMSSNETKLKLKENVGKKNQVKNAPKLMVAKETDLGKNDLDKNQRKEILMDTIGAETGMEKLTMKDEKIEDMIRSKILSDGNWPKVCLRRLNIFPGTLMPSKASVRENQKHRSHSNNEQKPRESERGSSSSESGSESKHSRSECCYELPYIDCDKVSEIDGDELPDHDIHNNNFGSSSQQQSTPNLVEEFMRHDVSENQTQQAMTKSSIPTSRDKPGEIVSNSSSTESYTQVIKDISRTQHVNPGMAKDCNLNAKSPVLHLAQLSSSFLIPDSRNISTSTVVAVSEISSSQIFFNQISQSVSGDLGSSLSSMGSCAILSSQFPPNDCEKDLHDKSNKFSTGSYENGLMTNSTQVANKRGLPMEVNTNNPRTECARPPPVSDSTPCMDNQNNNSTTKEVKKSTSLAEENDDDCANNNQELTTISPHCLSKNDTLKSLSSETSSRESTTADRNSDTDTARSSQKMMRQNMFKFRTLANKLISHIGKLQLLLDKKYSADNVLMKEIYSTFDALTAQWEKIETFIETLLESEQESEYLDELMDEAEKLRNSVTNISKDVLAVRGNITHVEKTFSEVREMQKGFKEEAL